MFIINTKLCFTDWMFRLHNGLHKVAKRLDAVFDVGPNELAEKLDVKDDKKTKSGRGHHKKMFNSAPLLLLSCHFHFNSKNKKYEKMIRYCKS